METVEKVWRASRSPPRMPGEHQGEREDHVEGLDQAPELRDEQQEHEDHRQVEPAQEPLERLLHLRHVAPQLDPVAGREVDLLVGRHQEVHGEVHARRAALPVEAEHRDDPAEVVVLDERRAAPLLDPRHRAERDHLALLPDDLHLLEVGPIAPLVPPVADQDGELPLVVEPVELVREAALQRVVGLIGHVLDREPDLLGAGAIHDDVELGQALRPGGGHLVEAGDLLGQLPRLFAHLRELLQIRPEEDRPGSAPRSRPSRRRPSP